MWNRANEDDLGCYFSFLIRLTLCIQTKYQAKIQAKTNTYTAPRVTLLTLPHTKPGRVSNNVLCNSIPLLPHAEDSPRRDTRDTQSRRPEHRASHTVLVKAFDLLLNCSGGWDTTSALPFGSATSHCLELLSRPAPSWSCISMSRSTSVSHPVSP